MKRVDMTDATLFYKVGKNLYMNVTDISLDDTYALSHVLDDLKAIEMDADYVIVENNGFNNERILAVDEDILKDLLNLRYSPNSEKFRPLLYGEHLENYLWGHSITDRFLIENEDGSLSVEKVAKENKPNLDKAILFVDNKVDKDAEVSNEIEQNQYSMEDYTITK